MFAMINHPFSRGSIVSSSSLPQRAATPDQEFFSTQAAQTRVFIPKSILVTLKATLVNIWRDIKITS